MTDELPRAKANSRYPMLSGLSLLSMPASCLIGYLVFGTTQG
jgi:hypothetical protein